MQKDMILLLDDQQDSRDFMIETLKDAQVPFRVGDDPTGTLADSTLELLARERGITTLIVRFHAGASGTCEQIRRIRMCRTAEDLLILVIVSEEHLRDGHLALQAGASNLLREPFEARELRMLAGIHVTSGSRRLDHSHTTVREDALSPGHANSSATNTETASPLVKPVFDRTSLKFQYPVPGDMVRHWQQDPRITPVQLDQMMVCPECHSLPTFRFGCGHCGSAVISRETLIHHFACACVAPAEDFRHEGDIVCPKCQLEGLVAGSDFEVVSGHWHCDDCGQLSRDTTLIGHCLSCGLRFSAQDASVVPLTGFHVPPALLPAAAEGRRIPHPEPRSRHSASSRETSVSD